MASHKPTRNPNVVASASHNVAGVTHVLRSDPFDGRDSMAAMKQSAMAITGSMPDGSRGGSPSGTRVKRLLILWVQRFRNGPAQKGRLKARPRTTAAPGVAGTFSKHANTNQSEFAHEGVQHMGDVSDWNAPVVQEFRSNEGKVSGWEGTPLLLLTTRGAKSGRRRTNPVVYLPDGDRVAVFGTKSGAPSHPDWFHNLVANPRVTLEVGTDSFEADARIATGEERERLWTEQKSRNPNFAAYEEKTDREIPVIILTRAS
jgi:deazaflavin-dependent oxidoreductase (nitroreductase family)